MTDDVITTRRGARVLILKRPTGGWIALRDDAHPIFGASSRFDVDDYVRRYGNDLQPAPPGRRLYF